MSLAWIKSRVGSPLPNNAVLAGSDSDGSQMFIGRAIHLGEQCTAKVIPSKNIAYISYNGLEIAYHIYEVLTGVGFSWVSCNLRTIPADAVSTGRLSNGESIFIGRTHHAGSLTPGKLIVSHGCLYFPYNGLENQAYNVEVLIYKPIINNKQDVFPRSIGFHIGNTAQGRSNGNRNSGSALACTSQSKYQWISSFATAQCPAEAHVGGHEMDGTPVYIGRANHNGYPLVAKIIPSKRVSYVTCNGKQISKQNIEVLCHGFVKWIEYNSNRGFPSSAIPVGPTSTGETLYIGRASYMGSVAIGKVVPSQKILYIAYNGAEIPIGQFDILCEY